jgi:hypothetical protein
MSSLVLMIISTFLVLSCTNKRYKQNDLKMLNFFDLFGLILIKQEKVRFSNVWFCYFGAQTMLRAFWNILFVWV